MGGDLFNFLSVLSVAATAVAAVLMPTFMTVQALGTKSSTAYFFEDQEQFAYLDESQSAQPSDPCLARTQSAEKPRSAWLGEGTEYLVGKKSGSAVERSDFESVIVRVQHPVTGDSFIQKQSKAKQRSTQVVFSAPKSVSVLYWCGTNEQRIDMISSHREAVRETLAEIDRETPRRRGQGGKRLDFASKKTWATFEHTLSRPVRRKREQVQPMGAPQLHTHAVTPSVGYSTDDSTGRCERSGLWKNTRRYGALYRSSLQRSLERRGYRCEETHTPKLSSFRLARYLTESAERAFSPRRCEVERILETKGLSGALSSEIAALSSRGPKSKATEQEHREHFQAILREHGCNLDARDVGEERGTHRGVVATDRDRRGERSKSRAPKAKGEGPGGGEEPTPPSKERQPKVRLGILFGGLVAGGLRVGDRVTLNQQKWLTRQGGELRGWRRMKYVIASATKRTSSSLVGRPGEHGVVEKIIARPTGRVGPFVQHMVIVRLGGSRRKGLLRAPRRVMVPANHVGRVLRRVDGNPKVTRSKAAMKAARRSASFKSRSTR